MKFRDIIAKFAPILGAALGGPAGAVVGKLISAKLGRSVEDITKNGVSTEEAGALVILESDMKIELERIKAGSQDIGAVNKTMRVEAKAEHWMQWAWRPFIGFTTGIAFLGVVLFIGIAMYKALFGGVPTAMGHIPLIISSFSALFAVPGAILGVASWHRGQAKRGN